MLRIASYSSVVPAVALLRVSALAAQQSPPDTVYRIAALQDVIVKAGPTIGPRIWPGFRPDTIPTLYVIPHRAKLFVQWRDTLPTGFVPLPGIAHSAWTDTRTVSFPRGRPIAFLSVDSTASAGSVLGLALHEQFHAFEQASARRGRRFGAGENSMIVATYPAFDVTNEAAFALEGRLLGRALRARSLADARQLAREFLAVREERHAHLDSTFVEFEAAAELHEGLAQYALIRGLRELASADARRFANAAASEARHESALLDSLLVVGPRSVRRRFYATGSALALLLDRLADSSWKAGLVRDDATLRHMLADAVGYTTRVALGTSSTRRTQAELSRIRRDAERAAATLGARRTAQRDSILNQPGVRLVVDPSRLPGGRLNWCFFDPQNVLQTPSGELLHMRVVRFCGGGIDVQFERPVVEDRKSGVVTSVVGESGALKLTTDGAPVALPGDGGTVEVSALRLESPTVTLTAVRATLVRRGNEVWVTPTR